MLTDIDTLKIRHLVHPKYNMSVDTAVHTDVWLLETITASVRDNIIIGCDDYQKAIRNIFGIRWYTK